MVATSVSQLLLDSRATSDIYRQNAFAKFSDLIRSRVWDQPGACRVTIRFVTHGGVGQGANSTGAHAPNDGGHGFAQMSMPILSDLFVVLSAFSGGDTQTT
jgi:hypothetical protein